MSKSLQSYTTTAGAYTFSATGRPQYGQSSVAERDARGGRVLRWRTRYTITQWFTEGTFGDNAARYAVLRAALAVPEGVLLIQDENGTTLVNKRVQVAGHELPEQWSASLSEVKVAFETVEEITASVFDATFTPTGLGAVTLPTVQGWKEHIEATRYSILVPERRESRQVVMCSGSVRANSDDTAANRLAALQTAAAALRGCDKKQGVLAYGGGFTQTMRCDSIDADLGDGSDELKWTGTFSRLAFPAGNYAEADFEVRQKDDPQANVRLTTVAGTIRAYDEAGAEAKRDTIAATYATGRMLLDSQFNRRKLDGSDGAEDAREWAFSLTYREILPDAVTAWTLNIDSKLDYLTGLITTTYSGRVTAVDSATALAKVTVLAGGKFPVPLSEEKNVGSMSADGTEQFTDVTFSYAYLSRGTALRAEVALRNADDPFGSVTQTVSGTAAADTEANALTLARTFIPAGLLVSKEETTGKSYHGVTPDTLFRTLAFTYTVQSGHASGTLEYGVRVTEDFDQYVTRTVWSGTVRSASKAASDTLIGTLVSGASGTLMLNDRQPRYRDSAADALLPLYLQTDFNLEYIGSLAANGNDILQADYSVDATYSIENTVVTPIPYGTPNVQTNTGTLPGSMVISGRVTCLTEATGRTWARSLRTLASGGYAQQPRERSDTHYLPRSTGSVRCHSVDFTYAYVFAELVMG